MDTSFTQPSGQAVELALQSLQIERVACIAQLTAALEQTDDSRDVDGYLERIENINAAMIRLASVSMKH